ncbi:MAG: N-acetylmuramoyl-L-alanine amidase [Thiobacillaceae bacterium]|nr:N-acetylmuramoyl-L-alanine amidase [Thiobacillaceae bacterium]
MKIVNHRLVRADGSPMPFVASPNMAGVMRPEYLVIHYTAGGSAEGSIAWFRNPQAQAAAHLVIGRDGAITQMVPFNRVAWHAGRSQWDGRSGLNGFSIGIELDNAGKLERVGSRWVSAVSKRAYADDDVLVAHHKHDRPGAPPCGWHEYSEAQIEACLTVGLLLMQRYELKDVLGHEDIAPGRKSDPGPAFPMGSYRGRLLGRHEDQPEVFLATTALNIRGGPGTQHAALPGSPLPAGTRLAVEEKQAVWWRVEVLDAASDEAAEGWVHSRFLAPEQA